MKTKNTIKKWKSVVLIYILFLSVVGLSSCEKSDDITPSKTAEVDPLIKQEVLVVVKSQWQTSGVNKEANLSCTVLSQTKVYDYVKVYVKVKKDRSQIEIWRELPFEAITYQVRGNKICVQRSLEWQAETTYFMIEAKLSSSQKIGYEAVDFNPQIDPLK